MKLKPYPSKSVLKKAEEEARKIDFSGLAQIGAYGTDVVKKLPAIGGEPEKFSEAIGSMIAELEILIYALDIWIKKNPEKREFVVAASRRMQDLQFFSIRMMGLRATAIKMNTARLLLEEAMK